ncbi:MAG: hypothetical protein AAF694_16525 [Bacteroidota bacterium]
MKLERIVLLLGGLTILGSFILPYFELDSSLTTGDSSLTLTGVDIFQTILNQFGAMDFPGGVPLIEFAAEKWNTAEGFEGLGLVAGLLAVMGIPLWFGSHALGYIFRALRGRQYSHGIFFSLLFLGFAWLMFYLWGGALGTSLNFFHMARIGFWVGFGGMLLAAFSLFFENAARKGV